MKGHGKCRVPFLLVLALTFPVLSPPFFFAIDAFCQALVNTLENTPGLSYIWSAVKPLLQGKILYTPDTPAARLLVKEVKSRQETKHNVNAPWPFLQFKIAEYVAHMGKVRLKAGSILCAEEQTNYWLSVSVWQSLQWGMKCTSSHKGTTWERK